MDNNWKEVLLALLNVVSVIAGYYFGFKRGTGLKK